MSGPKSRLSGVLGHLVPSSSHVDHDVNKVNNYHTLSPTFFLPRAAAIEPDVCASQILNGIDCSEVDC